MTAVISSRLQVITMRREMIELAMSVIATIPTIVTYSLLTFSILRRKVPPEITATDF